MTKTEFFYPSHDGVHRIHAILWKPDGSVRGVVQLVHGICEYIDRYEPFAQFLVEHGFAVTGNDHLGHGKSVTDESEYGYFTDWNDLVADVRTLRVRTGEELKDAPYFILGHSMGSFVTRTYLIDYPGTVAGAMLSGTAYYSPAAATFGKWLTALGDPRQVNKLFYAISIGAYNKSFAPARTSADWICRDTRVVDAYLADPMCSFSTKGGMTHAMMAGLRRVCDPRELERMELSTPVYFFAGDADPVGSMGKGVRKVERLFRTAGCQDVACRLYPGGRHEMLNETNKDEVFADLLAWLEAHMRPSATRRELSDRIPV